MAIETIGNYQLHLFAHQLPENGQWSPYVMVHKFDEAAQEFRCAIEKRHVGGDAVFPTYEAAIEAARREGNRLLESHRG